MTGFQKQVNIQPGVGIEGDFCSANPRASMLAGVGALVAGPAGVIVGRFAWADADGIVRNSGGLGRLGFVTRHQPALITNWLAESTLTVNPGLEITVHDTADVWCRFAAGASVGQKVFANYADGSAVAGTAGSPPAGASGSASTIAAGTSSFTGAINDNVLLVTGSVTGTIYVGTSLSGTGVASGTVIQSQISGTAGGAGTYLVSIGNQNVAATTISGSYGLFTAGGTITGTFVVGDVLLGTGVTAGTQITALGTGTGGAGTYAVNISQTASSTAISSTQAQESRWYVDSYAAAGELAKISVRG